MRPLIATVTGLAAVLGTAQPAAAQIEAQIFAGSAASLPLPITISQDGQPDLHFTAQWATHPGRQARYYAWRIGIWNGNRGWRLDHTHHKIYLTNPPPEVGEFKITNGFNILSLSRAFRRGNFSYSLGAGPVIAYPFNTVRGLSLAKDRGMGGYVLAGASVVAMATRSIPLTGRLTFDLDVRGSASRARVPVVTGHATVPNLALHFHGGLGYQLGRRR